MVRVMKEEKKFELDIRTDYLRTSESRTIDRESDPEIGKCNNFNDRKNGGEPKWIMQHHTVSDYDCTIDIFLHKIVSAHYVIAEDGTIQHMVADDKRAYHAGRGNLKYNSKLNPFMENITNDMNSWSIGIENVNNAVTPFEEAQIKSNVYLLDYLVEQYKINPKYVIGHADWDPGRKIDPSPYFPWQTLAKASTLYPGVEHDFGVYPLIKKEDNPDILVSYKVKTLEDVQHLQSQLEELGYPVVEQDQSNYGVFDNKTKSACISFKIHYLNTDITDNPDAMKFWELRCFGSEVVQDLANEYLSVWDINCDKVMGDVLDLYGA